MLGEDRVGGPVTTAKIVAVAEPLGCVVGDLIGPSSAHGYLPFRSSGLLWMATTQQPDRGLAPGLIKRNVIQGEMGRKHTI